MAEETKVVTHERFLRGARDEEQPKRMSESQAEESLRQLINSGAIKLEGSAEEVVLSSDTAGGKYLGQMTEQEIKLYTEAYSIKQRMNELGGVTVKAILNERFADILKEANNAMIDAAVRKDYSSLENLKKQYGTNTSLTAVIRQNITEQDKKDLSEASILDERYTAIIGYLHFILKSRFDALGKVVGVRSGWKVYEFGDKWQLDLKELADEDAGS